MRIFIPTYGRASIHLQTTLKELISWGVHPTLVVNSGGPAHVEEYRNALVSLKGEFTLWAAPDDIRGIGPVRDYIIRELSGGGKVLLLDDDLVFYVRREDDREKFEQGSIESFRDMLECIEETLDDYPLVGIAAREGGQRNTERFVENTRIMRLLAYDAGVLLREAIKFSDIEFMEDFHVALSLLERGYENCVVNDWCHNQRGSGTEGGCSATRTLERHCEAAHKLKELHPEFVRLTEKTTKTAWGGATRTDVVVSWKKAAGK